MKYLVCLLITAFSFTAVAQNIQIGQKIDNQLFEQTLNNNDSPIDISQFKGKPLIIEFWATWCGPCIQSMPHLEKIAKANKNSISVLTISDEDKSIVSNFLRQSDLKLPVAIDQGSIFSNSMGITALPTTFLISKNGELLAITSPDKITSQVINELKAGKLVSLVKNTQGFDNISHANNTVESGISERGLLSTYNPELPAFFYFEKNGEYANRRLIVSNMSLVNMYQKLYEMPDWQTKTNVNDKNSYRSDRTENLYTLDLIVPIGQESNLKELAIAVLNKETQLKSTVLSEPSNVKTIEVTNPSMLPPLAEGNEIPSQIGTFKEMADMFTAYNIYNKAVVDKTGLSNQKYVMNLNKFPTEPDKIAIIFSRIGLELKDQVDDASYLLLFE